jgi:hypothetical protein
MISMTAWKWLFASGTQCGHDLSFVSFAARSVATIKWPVRPPHVVCSHLNATHTCLPL